MVSSVLQVETLESINWDSVDLVEKEPPEVLYYGISSRDLCKVCRDGIQPRTGSHVRLSTCKTIARVVSSTYNSSLVLKVLANKAYEDGYKFYIISRDIWITEGIPNRYIVS